MQRIEPKRADRFEELLQTPQLRFNITVGKPPAIFQIAHYVFLKTQFYPSINQGRSPFATPQPFDKLIATKTTKKKY